MLISEDSRCMGAVLFFIPISYPSFSVIQSEVFDGRHSSAY